MFWGLWVVWLVEERGVFEMEVLGVGLSVGLLFGL